MNKSKLEFILFLASAKAGLRMWYRFMSMHRNLSAYIVVQIRQENPSSII